MEQETGGQVVNMSEEDRRAVAVDLIEGAIEDIEHLTVVEVAEEAIGGEISEEDAQAIHDLIGRVRLTITFD